MNSNKEKRESLLRRKTRVRAKIFGTSVRPRLSVFRSNRHITAQLINDEKANSLAYVNDKEQLGKLKKSKSEKALMVGKEIAKKAKKIGIKEAVFDRGGYKYHGRVKSVNEGARGEGLKC